MKPGVNDEQKNKERISEGWGREKKNSDESAMIEGGWTGREKREYTIERGRERMGNAWLSNGKGRCYGLIKGYRDSWKLLVDHGVIFPK